MCSFFVICGSSDEGIVNIMVMGWFCVIVMMLLVLLGEMMLLRLDCFRLMCLLIGVVIWVYESCSCVLLMVVWLILIVFLSWCSSDFCVLSCCFGIVFLVVRLW